MIGRLLTKALWAILSLCATLVILAALAMLYIAHDLPDVESLKEVNLQVPLRIYSDDLQLIAEFGEMRRIPVPLTEVPTPFIHAVLATEDQRFYSHPGVDVFGLGRATLEVLRTGDKVQGGSTITMQVARNFFLTRQKTYLRKVKEILLAIKIDRELTKDQILELYLNKIYFGNRAYGIASAAQVYYGSHLSELTLAQMAMLAGLPRAPSAINPLANPTAAMKRRNHVLDRMHNEGYIDQATQQAAKATPITANYHGPEVKVQAPYVAEMIRQAIYSRIGEAIYTDGYRIYTTIDSSLQTYANEALQEGLSDYDRRHGYRGPEGNIGDTDTETWPQQLKDYPRIHDLHPAVVTLVAEKSAEVVMRNGDRITIPWDGMSWARRQLPSGYMGKAPEKARDALHRGDVVRIKLRTDEPFVAHLTQVPEVEGALVSLAPQDGAIKAMVGGYAYQKSHFNRAVQATRQPGSSFKPFVYAAALAYGMNMATIINDAPIAMDDPSQETLWRPQNHTRKFYGPTRLRIGLINSRNLVSIRILQGMGIPFAVDYLARFGFDPDNLPHSLSLALGSLTVTPLELTTAYAMLTNGGNYMMPFVIREITNNQGDTILRNEPTPPRQPSIDPQVAYLISSALKDVIAEGTGRQALSLGRRDLAGKTGSTNKHIDAWFAGFNGNLVTAVWIGFDQPKSLREYAAQAALPIWTDYMGKALAGQPEYTRPQPAGMLTVRIDPENGLLAAPDQTNFVFETFREDNAPKQMNQPTSNIADYYEGGDTEVLQQLF